MQRRAFVAGSVTLLAARLAVEAQETGKRRRVGFLARGGEAGGRPLVQAFRNELRALGYTEGENLAMEWRWAGDRVDRLSDMAAELVRARMDVIVTPGTAETRAASQATSTIPLVMIHVGDPVDAGFVRTLARPAGNVTGLSFQFPELSAKQLELFRDCVAGAKVIAVSWHPSNPSHPPALEALQRAAPALGVHLRPVSTEASGLEAAFAGVRKDGISALFVLGEPRIFEQRARLAELALKNRIATMFNLREHAEAGGLMAYGVHFPDLYRRAAAYVDKLLKGARAADLPVEQPTRFELVINLKTATALGITMPPLLLLRADQVIE